MPVARKLWQLILVPMPAAMARRWIIECTLAWARGSLASSFACRNVEFAERSCQNVSSGFDATRVLNFR
jgi:hypothetical protein